MTTQNKKSRFFVAASISFIVAGIAIIMFCILSPDVNIQPLPEKFRTYKDIKDIKETTLYEVIEFETSLNCIPTLDTVNNYILICANSRNINKEDRPDNTDILTLYKLGYRGNILDSLKINHSETIRFENYIITPDYYSTWLIDGSKDDKKYKEINKEFSLSEPDLKKRFEELYMASDKVVYKNIFNTDSTSRINEIDRAYFIKNRVITCLYGKNAVDCYTYPIKGNYRTGNGWMEESLMDGSFSEGKYAEVDTDLFTMNYFYREEYIKKGLFKLPSFFVEAIYNSPDRWEGTGYFDIYLHSDTLRITKPMIEIKKSINSYSVPITLYYLYTAPKYDCLILTKDEKHCYLIRPKN